MSEPVPPPKKKRKVSIPTVITLLVLLAVVLWQRNWIADQAKLKGIIDADAPDPVAIKDLVDRSSRPHKVLTKLWRSEKIPHRWEVVSYLNRHAGTTPEVLEDLGFIIDESTWDRDMSVRFIGVNLARITGRPTWLDAARGQLTDPDHEVRLESLHVLNRSQATNALADIVNCLGDDHRAVREFAAGMTRNFAGVPFPGSNLVAEINQWWTTNRSGYPQLPAVREIEPSMGPSFGHLVFESFKGEPVPLSRFAGKPVLLSFFATWSAPSLLQFPALMQLNTLHGEQIKIIGVGIDPIASDRTKHGDAFDPAEAKKHVIRMVSMRRVNYEVVFDPVGQALLQTEGAEIPAHILLNSEHRLVRRFTGFRDAKAMTRIVTDLLQLNSN
ncbi:MAG: hypothetical protein ACPGVU_06865 [Limisphaerales bacterium]